MVWRDYVYDSVWMCEWVCCSDWSLRIGGHYEWGVGCIIRSNYGCWCWIDWNVSKQDGRCNSRWPVYSCAGEYKWRGVWKGRTVVNTARRVPLVRREREREKEDTAAKQGVLAKCTWMRNCQREGCQKNRGRQEELERERDGERNRGRGRERGRERKKGESSRREEEREGRQRKRETSKKRTRRTDQREREIEDNKIQREETKTLVRTFREHFGQEVRRVKLRSWKFILNYL